MSQGFSSHTLGGFRTVGIPLGGSIDFISLGVFRLGRAPSLNMTNKNSRGPKADGYQLPATNYNVFTHVRP